MTRAAGYLIAAASEAYGLPVTDARLIPLALADLARLRGAQGRLQLKPEWRVA